MKQFVIISLFITLVAECDGQTYSEWFRQKKTQKKYLIEQIAALQMYAGYLEKGYSTVMDGLSYINSIKHGDFNLHNAYFRSLKKVNQLVKHCKIANWIISSHEEIKSISKRVLKNVKGFQIFNAEQKDYIESVFKKLLEGCDTNVQLLSQLLTPGLLSLRDDERLHQINRLYEDMQERYLFTRTFEKKIHQIELIAVSEEREIERTRKMVDIIK